MAQLGAAVSAALQWQCGSGWSVWRDLERPLRGQLSFKQKSPEVVFFLPWILKKHVNIWMLLVLLVGWDSLMLLPTLLSRLSALRCQHSASMKMKPLGDISQVFLKPGSLYPAWHHSKTNMKQKTSKNITGSIDPSKQQSNEAQLNGSNGSETGKFGAGAFSTACSPS